MARYNHILWKGIIGKNETYAHSAIENYIEAIKDYYKLFSNKKIEEGSYQIGRLYDNLIGLANEVKTSSEEIKTTTSFLLYKANKLNFSTKHGIIKDMLKYSKIFKPVDFNNVLELFEEGIKRRWDSR